MLKKSSQPHSFLIRIKGAHPLNWFEYIKISLATKIDLANIDSNNLVKKF